MTQIATIPWTKGTTKRKINHQGLLTIWSKTRVEYIGMIEAQPGFPALTQISHAGIINNGTMKKIINKNKNPTIKIKEPESFFISII